MQTVLRRKRELAALGMESRPAHASIVSPLAFAVSSALIVICCVALSAIVATYAGVSERDFHRTPVFASEEEPGSTALLLYRDVHDSLPSIGEDATIVYIEPLAPEAPLPPGLSQWPAPGEVIASPALLEAGEPEGIDSRYGKVAGVIAAEGLATPTEKLAYVRPALGMLDKSVMYQVAGFGASTDVGMLGDAVDRQPAWRFIVAFLLTVGLATAIVASFGVRSSLERRRYENTVLLTIGYTRCERVFWQWGKLRGPFALGVFLGALVSSVPFVTDISLPARNFVVQSRDMHAFAIPTAVFVLAMIGLYLFVAVYLSVSQPRQFSFNRPVANDKPFSKRKAIVCFAATPAAVVLMFILNKTGVPVLFLLYVLALCVVIFTLPDLLALLVSRWAGSIRNKGRNQNNPGSIIGAANLQCGGAAAVKFSYLMSVILIISAQVLMLLIARAHSNYEALARHQHFEHKVVEIRMMPDADASLAVQPMRELQQLIPQSRIVVFRDALAKENNPVFEIATQTDDLASHDLHIDAVAWEYLRVVSPPGQDIQESAIDFDAMVRSMEADRGDWDVVYWFAVLAPERGTVSVELVKEFVGNQAAPMWRVDSPDTGAYVGTALGVRQASWVGWLGIVALGVTLIGVVVVLIEDSAKVARVMAPLTVLMGAPRTLYRAIGVRFIVPVAIGLGVGILLAFMLGSALSVSAGGQIAFLVPFALAATVLGLLITTVGYLSALWVSYRALSNWRVGDS